MEENPKMYKKLAHVSQKMSKFASKKKNGYEKNYF